MPQLRTFIHQERLMENEGRRDARISRSDIPHKVEEDRKDTIDHRMVEEHRLKWWKWFDLFFYVLGAIFIAYAIYEWLDT